MTRLRIIACAVATTAAVALLALAARQAQAGDAAVTERPAPPAASPAKVAPPAAQPASRGGKRQRVPAGVLARAASRRAQEREATSATPPEPRRAPGGEDGAAVSVEIDWNASSAAQ